MCNAEERFAITKRNVLYRIQKRSRPYLNHSWPVSAKDYLDFEYQSWGKFMTSKEYRCVLHYENERKEVPYRSMAEAVHAMRSAIMDKQSPIFIEVVMVTTERVAYHQPLK